MCNFLNRQRDIQILIFHFVLVKGILGSRKGALSQREMCGAVLTLGQIQHNPWSWGSSDLGEQERSNEVFITLC